MKTHVHAAADARPSFVHVPEVASYLEDIEEEISPESLQTYIMELKELVSPGDYAELEGACHLLAEAQAAVHRVARRLA